MARVLALIPDLLFGSRVQGSLTAAGHEVELLANPDLVRSKLSDVDGQDVKVLVVDLTDEAHARARGIHFLLSHTGTPGQELRTPGRERGRIRTLAFYSHVDTQARAYAEEAGFDLVVPRSRMAREGGQLVTDLARDR
jgi:hypothetical protein